MKKYVDILLQHKKKFFISLLIINVIAVIGVFQIKLNTDFSLFSTKESNYQTLLDDANDSFGEMSQIVILLEDNSFETNDVAELRGFQEKLEEMNNISMVNGVAPEFISSNSGQVQLTSLSATQLRTYYSQLGDFSPMIEKEDKVYYQFTIIITDEFDQDDITYIETEIEEYSYDFYIAGDVYNQTKIIQYITFILMFLPPLALLTILFVFKMQIGSLKATILSVVPAGLGALWTMGLIGYIGREVSILSAVVPIFVIVIGSADGLHFMSHIQDARKEGYGKLESITHTLKMVGIPMIVTTLTSMVGFLALLSMNTESIVDLAVYASIGILFAGIATWYVLPLILTGDVKGIQSKKRRPKFSLGESLKNLWDVPSIVIAVFLIVLAGIFVSRINNEFNMLMVYKDYTVVNQNAEKIDEVVGGAIPLYVVIEPDEDITSINSMNQVNQLAAKLALSEEVNKVVNPYVFIQIMFSQASLGQELTTDESLTIFYNQSKLNPTSPSATMFSEEDNKVRLLVFPANMNNATLGNIEDIVDEDDNSYITGVQFLMKDLNEQISQMQLYSILIALGAVLVMLIITIKSLKISVISLLPIILSILGVYAFLGISQISLNVTTTIIFSITIGVGIDYAVHFSSVYKVFLDENMTKNQAVVKAYKYTSRPIIANALGISIGFTILMLSPLRIHFNVAVLMWVSMGVSVLMTLTLLPTLLGDMPKRR